MILGDWHSDSNVSILLLSLSSAACCCSWHLHVANEWASFVASPISAVYLSYTLCLVPPLHILSKIFDCLLVTPKFVKLTVSGLCVDNGNVVLSDSYSVSVIPLFLLNHLYGFGTAQQISYDGQPHSPGPGLPAIDNGYDISQSK